eukprot:5063988-Pyramimonas_sp.AAC.1
MPLHVTVDVSRSIDVTQYFRCPIVMGPGLAKQWGLHRNFDYLTCDLTRHMKAIGIAVLPADQWIESYDK